MADESQAEAAERQSEDALPRRALPQRERAQRELPVQAMRNGLVLPVLTLDDPVQAVPLAESLQAAGLGVLEITLRTPAALLVIEAIAKAVPFLEIGAGTVCTASDLQHAADAGASFAVSPGATPALLGAKGCLPLIPGVATASEAMVAYEAGYDLLKLFPASTCGGPAVLRSWAGPLADLRFVPTGGIKGNTAPDYLALDNVECVGGSWLVPSHLVAEGDWRGVETAVRSSLDALRTTLD